MKLLSTTPRRGLLWCVALVMLLLVAAASSVNAQAAEAQNARRGGAERHGSSTEERRQTDVEQARQATEKAKRSVDTVEMIRDSAKELPQGCASLVEEYLFRIHEHRQRVAAAVSDARSELNEARVRAPEKVEELERNLAAKQDDLLVYDLKTLRMYGGNLPKTCIGEAQVWLERQPLVQVTNNYVQAYTYFYRIVAAHCKTLQETARGLMHYLVRSYTPAAASYTKMAQRYFDEAATLYTELMSMVGQWANLPLFTLEKQFLRMLGYASVPIGIGVAAGIIAVAVLPALVGVVVLHEFVYKIWVELFFAYYIYGVQMPRGAIMALKGALAAAQAGNWAAIGDGVIKMFFDLVVDSEKIFYNGMIALYLIGSIAALCSVSMWVWWRLLIPGARAKQRPSPLKSSRRSAKRKAAAASADANSKKKN